MLGPRIATLRREMGLSQGQLAQQLQVSPSAIGMYEQGRREPSAELLVAMAEFFHVTLDYLLTGQAAPTEQTRITSAARAVFDQTQQQLQNRQNRPLSRQELAVLFAALLIES